MEVSPIRFSNSVNLFHHHVDLRIRGYLFSANYTYPLGLMEFHSNHKFQEKAIPFP